MRAAVERNRAATIGRDELRVLCPDEMTVPEQFQRIAEIAEEEGWNFAFLPDGRVQFARLCGAT